MDYRTVVKICLLFLAVNIQLASAATHSMQYMVTEVTPEGILPQYYMVGRVDAQQFVYYDSNTRKVIPQTEWMKKIVDDEYWDSENQISQGNEESYKVRMSVLMQRFNQSKGIHTFQWMYGCELGDDGTKSKRGYSQYGYDGEDFLSLDLNTLTWTAPVPQAVPTKHKWEVLEGGAWAAQVKNYVENECIYWLEKYVGYGRSTLERKVPPKVSLFQKDSSSPVVCHATGFFPREVMISWQKNGEDLHEGAEIRETLPNQDGNFQKRSLLKVSPEELNNNEYTCVVQHRSLKEDLVLQVSDRRVLSGGGSYGIIIGAVVAVLLLVLIVACVGVFIWKKKKSGFKPVSGNPNAPSEGDSSSNNS